MGLWLVGSAVLMTNNNNRPTGFYIKYLEALNAKRKAMGLPPAPDIHSESYWEQWRDQHGLNKAEAERDK